MRPEHATAAGDGGIGVGAVYWPDLHPLFAAHPDVIQVAEIEPSGFWIRGPDGSLRSNMAALEAIALLPQAKLIHGVGYPVGGSVCDNAVHIPELRRWAERLDAPWTSEHLSFNETAAGAAGFLLPPSQSAAGVSVAVANIAARKAALGRPFAFETGVNYLPPRPGEMEDGRYFAEVADRADCHILVDLHNLWANELNGRSTVADVISQLPLDRVCEIHIAGGEEKDGFWLDAHSGPVPDRLMALAREIMAQLPALRAILFEIAPDRLRRTGSAAVLRQIEALHDLWERRGRGAPATRRPAASFPDEAAGPEAHEAELVQALAGPGGPEDDPAFALYRSLIASYRDGTLAATLSRTLRLLQLILGEAAVERMLADYRAATGQPLYRAEEALQFADWLSRNGPRDPYVDDMLKLEAGVVRLAREGVEGELRFRHDPSLIAAAVAQGRVPADLVPGDYRLRLGPEGVRPAAT